MQAADAICRGVFFRCKNKECKRIFELKLSDAVPMCLSEGRVKYGSDKRRRDRT